MLVKKQQLEPYMEQRTGSKLGKEYIKGVCYHPAYLTYMQSTIMQNAGLNEFQAGIKVAGRSINNLRYADDTTLMAESEELKSLLMKVKEESAKAGLKLNIQKMNIMASGTITSQQIDGETVETVTVFILGSKITVNGNCSLEIKILASWKKAMINETAYYKAETSLCQQKFIVKTGFDYYGFSSSHVQM